VAAAEAQQQAEAAQQDASAAAERRAVAEKAASAADDAHAAAQAALEELEEPEAVAPSLSTPGRVGRNTGGTRRCATGLGVVACGCG
jgi:hypothetical protein